MTALSTETAPLPAQIDPRAGAVLSKAVVRAARLLGFSQGRLAEIIGISPATASRLFAGRWQLDPAQKKVWEHAALFARLFRSLDALLGHEAQAKTWLAGQHAALNGSPAELLRTTEGLVRVVGYLDAYRGRL